MSAYCLCCYLQFDNGADRLADALADKAEHPLAKELIDRSFPDFGGFNISVR